MSTPATEKATDAKLKELKQSFLNEMAEAAVHLLPEVISKVMVDEDLDQQRKFLDLAVGTLGWKQAPPKDAMDNLPVFQFNFTGATMTGEITQVSAQPLEMVQEVHDAIEATPASPFANKDEDDPLGVAALDAVLAKADMGHRNYAARLVNGDVTE